MGEVKKRDGGVELFRCLLMMVIILHHCCLFGSVPRSLAACFLFPLTMIGVDCFVAISGWYGINFSWKRFFRIWFTMAYYIVLVYELGWLAHQLGWLEAPPPKRPPWWFAYSYLCLMLIAPILNIVIKTLSNEPKALIRLWTLYAVAMVAASWPFSKLSLITGSGWGSHTVNTMMFVYFSMGTLRVALNHYPLQVNWRKWFGWMLFIFLFLLPMTNWIIFCGVKISETFARLLSYAGINTAQLIGAMSFGCSGILTVRLGGYNSPLVWTTAILAFMSFRTIKLPAWLERVILFISPSMFGVYLFHESIVGRRIYQIPMAYLTEHCPQIPDAVNLFGCMLLTFTVSLGVDLLRRGGLAIIRKVCVYPKKSAA